MRAMARRVADDILLNSGFWDKNLPIDIKAIIEKGGIIIEYKGENPNILGEIEIKDDQPIITIYESGNEARDRFTLAHELGHYVFHHVSKNTDRLHRVDSIGMQANNKEIQANSFAAEILVPLWGIEYVLDMKKYNTIDELAELFGVSRQMMEFRLEAFRRK
jgi:Zn-dependent peptidase ImmA (M78 family)